MNPPVVVGLLLLLACLGLAWRHRATPPVQVDQPVVCAMQPTPIDIQVQEAIIESPSIVLPTPADDVYARLAVCLREHQVWGDSHVTVEQVRHWVEVEKDPVWRENEAWWLPLSGEGDPQFPSGIYISVPDIGTTCGGAIVN